MTTNFEKLDLEEVKNSVENEIQKILFEELLPDYQVLHEIMIYHMGWDPASENGKAAGKRLRPIFMLLCAQAAGGEWRKSLPAAAAVELLHNFTLIHDDIQDNSPIRHGRNSVWVKWNVPLAINAGDAMFALANLSLQRLAPAVADSVILQAQKILLETCIHLTYGQHLDISNETKNEIETSQYLEMIQGKTAALVGASMEIGVLTAGGDQKMIENARNLGIAVGMAFQVIDDILGIWGETALTGKSAESDILSRKLSLPILYGIQQKKEFSRRWEKNTFDASDIPELAFVLEQEGAKVYSEKIAENYTMQAMEFINRPGFDNPAGRQLQEVCQSLLTRKY